MQLNNKITLITGAASGIGFGIAEIYAKATATVILVDVNLEACQNAAAIIAKHHDVETLAFQADVTDETAITTIVDNVIKQFGQLDVVNCNAGIQILSAFHEFDYQQWRKIIDIHINGSFLLAKAAMKYMRQQPNGGAIIITGSVHSFLASKEKSAYVTAKHAQLGMVRAIAKEGGSYNVRANLLAPGFVLTPLVEKQIPELAKKIGLTEQQVITDILLKDTVDGKFTTIEDIAQVSLFLASFTSNALSGQAIVVSNGWHMD